MPFFALYVCENCGSAISSVGCPRVYKPFSYGANGSAFIALACKRCRHAFLYEEKRREIHVKLAEGAKLDDVVVVPLMCSEPSCNDIVEILCTLPADNTGDDIVSFATTVIPGFGCHNGHRLRRYGMREAASEVSEDPRDEALVQQLAKNIGRIQEALREEDPKLRHQKIRETLRQFKYEREHPEES